MDRLTKQPVVLKPIPANPNPDEFYGCVDEFTDEFVRGWAARGDGCAEPITLEVLLNDVVVGRVYTSQFREDIARICRTTLRAGFRFNLADLAIPPELIANAGVSTSLALRVEGTDLYLIPERPEMPAAALCRVLEAQKARRQTNLKAHLQLLDELRPEVRPAGRASSDSVRLIAFYLPQFHPIRENNEWWGEGFTEWSSVTRARPLFSGHYQPHLPADLGFYDLRVPEVREQQARLAREHGIHGFCYYYYWFSGHRILDSPLKEVLASGKPDFPFCICWANENWTRRWDGSEHEVLLGQHHTLENDIEFIRDVLPILKDPRYIKVNGSPLLVVYRASLFEDACNTVAEWRRICLEAGLPGLHLCMAETFGDKDPRKYGFDSAVEFPPHGIALKEISADIPDLPEDFTGKVYDYTEAVEASLSAAAPDYRRYRSVMMAWDNTPRRGKAGHVFHHFSPGAYETWLRGSIDITQASYPPGERLLFINAWNEWGEGTHLEPDMEHGRACLDATRSAVAGQSNWRVLLEEARMRNGLDKAEVEQLIGRLEPIFSSYERSTHHLRRKLQSSTPSLVRTHFSPYSPGPVSGLAAVADGRSQIDFANGRTSLAGAVFSREETLFLRGWAFCDGLTIHRDTPCFLAAEHLATHQTFYATIHEREERADVVKAFGWPEPYTRYAGFNLSISLAELPDGQYVFRLLQPHDAHVAMTTLKGTVTVVSAAH